MFSSDDLSELVAVDARPAVSLYLPTHVAGREIRQDPIRLKNLIAGTAKRIRKNYPKPVAEALLAPAQALIDDENFWRHQQPGLAVFLAPDFHRVHRLPLAVPEEGLLGRCFHIKPLLPILDDAGRFWLLAISEARTRLYEGSRWRLAAAPAGDLPQGVDFIRDATLYQTKYARPESRHGAVAHAQTIGEAPDEIGKTELLDLLQRIATAVAPHIKRRPAPVVVAAQSQVLGHFREIAGWPEILPVGMAENPDALSEEELRRRVCALIAPTHVAAREAALGRLGGLRGTGKAAADPAEIVGAAVEGRIDVLFVDCDRHFWGQIDAAAGQSVASDSPAEDDLDLLDYAAVMTLRHGGSVMAVSHEALPASDIAAAILRY
ncbi:MAG: hypothetical protein WA417_10435 [Stellaceae bacterium]